MTQRLPHYLRFARGLALVSGVALSGCAASVGPWDGSGPLPDPPLADASSSASDANTTGAGPCATITREASWHQPCTTPGMVCGDDPCSGLTCIQRYDADAGTYWWHGSVCNGPLPPPELTTV